MSAEELAFYRTEAQKVFYPTSTDQNGPKAANDSDVFLSIMRKLVEENDDRITPLGEIHYKSKNQKQFTAAWRKISDEDFLVVDEAVFIKSYPKAVKADKSIDGTFCQQENWARELQKALATQEIIKKASSGYRYRMNLYGTGENVYVLAIPADHLRD